MGMAHKRTFKGETWTRSARFAGWLCVRMPSGDTYDVPPQSSRIPACVRRAFAVTATPDPRNLISAL
jgi:hypothetical protein